MRIAELFGELKLKITGDSLAELQKFESSLRGIATAAKDAAAALAILAKAKVPRGLAQVTTATVRSTSTTTTNATVAQPGVVAVPGNNATVAQPGVVAVPGTPVGAPGQTPTAVLQGLKSLGSLGLKLLGITAIVGTLKMLANTLSRWVGASVDAVKATTLFTRQTGLSNQTMQEWELAAKKAGLNEGEAANALSGFTHAWQRMNLLGEGNTGAFGLLGIDPSASADKIFERFRERSKNMTRPQAVLFGEELGFTKDFAAFLHGMRGELKSLNGLVLTGDEQKRVNDLNSAWVEMSTKIGMLRDKIVSDASPAISDWMKLIGDTAEQLIKKRERYEEHFSGLMDMFDPGTSQIRLPERKLFSGANPYFGGGGGGDAMSVGTVNVYGVKDTSQLIEELRQLKTTGSPSRAAYQRSPVPTPQ
jgi:hypothetical protein